MNAWSADMADEFFGALNACDADPEVRCKILEAFLSDLYSFLGAFKVI